jgi:hypothetical protein
MESREENEMSFKNIMAVAGLGFAMAATPGIGHNMAPVSTLQTPTENRAVLPRRIADENRRNQKLKQRLRRKKRIERLQKYTRFQRKAQKFGADYRPGKLFKGHRI